MNWDIFSHVVQIGFSSLACIIARWPRKWINFDEEKTKSGNHLLLFVSISQLSLAFCGTFVDCYVTQDRGPSNDDRFDVSPYGPLVGLITIGLLMLIQSIVGARTCLEWNPSMISNKNLLDLSNAHTNDNQNERQNKDELSANDNKDKNDDMTSSCYLFHKKYAISSTAS